MRTLRLFAVRADRETGEWLDEPEEIGTVDHLDWLAMQDEDDLHFDIFERSGETRAIKMTFV